ncbi:MAG: type 1 glutamine amidotransferase-like domain-containing protein [Proteobacteria bacterium]|nr:type 1 glutamine amidotransferase-like domain-containing protein [Pseudomonadota bacterium]
MVNKIIVAFGGGEMGRTKVLEDGAVKEYPIETMLIDKEIIKLSGVKNPKFLFIGTASYDKDVYFETVNHHFGNRLNCQVSRLNIAEIDISPEEIENIILSNDIIYVGGGDVIFMLERWRELQVDKALIKAYNQGVVLSGPSAGAICWFDWVDNFDDKEQAGFKPELVKGLGLIEGFAVPHYEDISDGEKQELQNLFTDKKGTYYGIDNCAAIISENGKLRFLSSKEGRTVKIIQNN